jgi:E3 ubiquitin-protein ligase UBR1
MFLSESESNLLRRLRDAPQEHGYRYTDEARIALLKELFRSLRCHRREYMGYFFPKGEPTENIPGAWKLSSAQGATEGAEYGASARGKPCGHIFKSGEATYRCK